LERGFTLLELEAVMVVTLLFSGLLIYFSFQIWRGTATLSNNLETFSGRLTASDRLREAINASSGLITQNSISDDHVGAPDTSVASGKYWLPVHAIPGVKNIGAAGTITPVMYFKAPSVDTSKNFILNGTQPYEDEYLLYMDGSAKELRMRELANPSASGSRITTTCPASAVSSTCPIDRLIAENISSVTLRFFSRSGNLIDYTSITDPSTGQYVGPDMPSVEVAELVLYVFKKSTVHGGTDSTSQTIIRIALRNK
jgi:hypothetical protein